MEKSGGVDLSVRFGARGLKVFLKEVEECCNKEFGRKVQMFVG